MDSDEFEMGDFYDTEKHVLKNQQAMRASFRYFSIDLCSQILAQIDGQTLGRSLLTNGSPPV